MIIFKTTHYGDECKAIYVTHTGETILLKEEPVFSFDYCFITGTENELSRHDCISNETYILSSDELKEVLDYVNS